MKLLDRIFGAAATPDTCYRIIPVPPADETLEAQLEGEHYQTSETTCRCGFAIACPSDKEQVQKLLDHIMVASISSDEILPVDFLEGDPGQPDEGLSGLLEFIEPDDSNIPRIPAVPSESKEVVPPSSAQPLTIGSPAVLPTVTPKETEYQLPPYEPTRLWAVHFRAWVTRLLEGVVGYMNRLFVHYRVQISDHAKCPACGHRRKHRVVFSEAHASLLHQCAFCGACWGERPIVPAPQWRVEIHVAAEDFAEAADKPKTASRKPIIVAAAKTHVD